MSDIVIRMKRREATYLSQDDASMLEAGNRVLALGDEIEVTIRPVLPKWLEKPVSRDPATSIYSAASAVFLNDSQFEQLGRPKRVRITPVEDDKT